MTRTTSFVIFFAIAVTVVALAHRYLWMRLVRDPAWPGPWRTVGTILLINLGCLIPAYAIFRWVTGVGHWLVAAASYGWLAVALLLVMVTAVVDLVRGMVWLGEWVMAWWRSQPEQPEDPERRLVIARGIAGAVLGLATIPAVVGVRSALGEVDTVEAEIKLDRLPPALSGLTIAQLSDLHLGPMLRGRWLEGIVERTNAVAPDLVVITGDVVDGSVEQLRPHIAPLMDLQSRYGTFVVSGNHEFYSGIEQWMVELRRMGIRVLDNERVSIGDPGPGGASIDLAGIHDPTGERYSVAAPDLGRALEGRDPEREVVLLAHQPKAIYGAAAADVGLQLSGHTHGGQIWPFNYVVELIQPYVAGLARHEATRTQIYVNRGTGFWGPPIRIAAPAEITKIVLTS